MAEERTEPSAAAAPAGELDVPPTVVATTTIAVNRRLGRGGIGDVYTASDRATGRSLAVKFLNDWAIEQASCREAFAFEATVTSQLEHPNIVPVYVTGATPDGKPFYAMRLIPGRTLAAAIAEFHDRRRAGDSAEARSERYNELLAQFALACKAIAYAHDRGVIHRDIKPANIMLGRFGEVVVLDWGLAARVDRDDKARSSGEQSIVMPTMAVDSAPAEKRGISGTPAYMSPEQHDGARRIGPASDVYGLGATLYHILAGHAPFEGDVAAIREKSLAGDIQSPSRVKRGVSHAIESVCLKAMARDPVDRYETPLELARDVEHYLADLPVSSYREPLLRRAARWARRHRTVAQLATAALVLLLLTAGTAAVLLKQLAGQEYAARQTALLMAARLAASTAALQIDSRWRILENEARNPDLVAALEAAGREGGAGQGDGGGDGDGHWRAIQAAVAEIAATHRDSVDAESWFVCDLDGVQVARLPMADTIGMRFAHRDYFHGGEADLPPGTAAAPLREVHRSSVYKSMTTGKLKVAFSAPIWSGPPGKQGRACLGVLVMAFDVGVLFRSIDAIGGWNAARNSYVVAVIDLREDRIEGEPKSGLMLENPALAAVDAVASITAQETRAPAAVVDRLKAAAGRWRTGSALQDPTELAFDVEVPTIAAAEPIIILGRPDHLADVGWAVIVHER
jgi:eukaryotic-like serine/threonine-protein kinase